MCTVSAIHDYAQRWVPNQVPNTTGGWPSQYQWPQSGLGGLGQVAQSKMDAEALTLLKKILVLCEKLDAKMGEPDCIDPEKAKVMAALEEYVESQKFAGV